MNGTDYQLIVWVLILLMFKNKVNIYLRTAGYHIGWTLDKTEGSLAYLPSRVCLGGYLDKSL